MQMRDDSKTSQTGFTLPELLVVGVIVLFFVGTMLMLLRPANYGADQRNAERWLALAYMMQGIAAYKKATGQLPPHLPAQEAALSNIDSEAPTLCNDLVPTYLKDLPSDPEAGLRYDDTLACNADGQIFETGYNIRAEGGHVILTAPNAEKKQSISVERWFPLF